MSNVKDAKIPQFCSPCALHHPLVWCPFQLLSQGPQVLVTACKLGNSLSFHLSSTSVLSEVVPET